MNSCNNDIEQYIPQDTLFQKIDIQKAGIDFRNILTSTREVNVYTFRNFYNGAGVGIGDFNNDGFADIFFCGNQVDNSLYLNKGNFTFKDISSQAGVASQNVWSTGVSVVDINGDGWLDLYICKSGDATGANRHNELFINQGIKSTDENGLATVSFKEQSKSYGLDDIGLSTHAAFFDYDLDGDLDCYLLNNSFRSVGNYDLRPNQREIRDPEGGNKLFKNVMVENGSDLSKSNFVDVSEEAGIYGSAIGFGLGVTVGDMNNDGWPDIFVSNDFFEKDYLYINQQNGRFTESIDEYTTEISMGSMGADLADINNDALPDLFVTEMLPSDEQRLKSKAQFENWNKYNANLTNGYHRQFARNVLQLNNGSNRFSEIGRLAGVEATDWSWGSLLFDMDNDGFKDIFVANGIYKDLLDQDYINFFSNPEEVRKILFDKKGGIEQLVNEIPSESLQNAVFKNERGSLNFTNVANQWGFIEKTFSNGAAYSDLDNDGDLDLVINNINDKPIIYKNGTQEKGQCNYLQISLEDSLSLNRNGLGAKIKLYQEEQQQFIELNHARGFMSSVEAKAHFGLANNDDIDSIVILWPDNKKQIINHVQANQKLIIKKESSIQKSAPITKNNYQFSEDKSFNPAFIHQENDYSDFDRESLLLTMHSNEGPASCTGDINNDGLIDFYIGGASGQAGQLFLQKRNGFFVEINSDVFKPHTDSEDIDCMFTDVNGDQFDDLYIASGSSEFGSNNINLADRLYFNTRQNKFTISPQILPSFKFEFSSGVDEFDFDNDGDRDLIVTTFQKPFVYGIPSDIYVLENDGQGTFMNKKSIALNKVGMMTDLDVFDFDQDGDDDFVVVGEWMSPIIFSNENGEFERQNIEGLQSNGLWNVVKTKDLNNDGHIDVIVGNHGLNSRITATSEFPFRMYVNDFDKNGKPEQIFTQQSDNGEFVFAQRNDLMKQLPYLNKQFTDFKSYATETVSGIFSEEQLSSSIVYELTELNSGVFWNNGDGSFSLTPFPTQAQLSSVYAIEFLDINGDSLVDILLGGNQFRAKPELGISGASQGLVLLQTENDNFEIMDYNQSGISIDNEVRSIHTLQTKSNTKLLFVRNNDKPIMMTKND